MFFNWLCSQYAALKRYYKWPSQKYVFEFEWLTIISPSPYPLCNVMFIVKKSGPLTWVRYLSLGIENHNTAKIFSWVFRQKRTKQQRTILKEFFSLTKQTLVSEISNLSYPISFIFDFVFLIDLISWINWPFSSLSPSRFVIIRSVFFCRFCFYFFFREFY